MFEEKGNILLPLISAVAVIALFAAAYFFWQNQQLQKPNQALNPTPTTNTGANTKFPTNTQTGETANWKTYEDSKYHYSISYPNDWTYELSQLPYQQAESLGLHSPPKNADPSDPTRFSNTAFIQITASTGDYSSTGISNEWTKNSSVAGLDAYKKLTPATTQTSAQELVAFKKDNQYFIAFMSYTNPDFVKTFDQILSAFKFKEPAFISNVPQNTITYTSKSLGISFNYLDLPDSPQRIKIKEDGRKIYLYGQNFKDYKEGQWVEVFTKDSADSLSQAIKKQLLTNISPSDCFISTPAKYKTGLNSYPPSYQTAFIDVPKSANDDLSTLLPKWQKCNEPYVTENGISYFLMDLSHPDKFLYFSIGQYPINSVVEGQTWQDTIKFL